MASWGKAPITLLKREMLPLRGIGGSLCSATKSARMATPRGDNSYLRGSPGGTNGARRSGKGRSIMMIPLGGEFTEQDFKDAISLGLPGWFQLVAIAITLAFAVPILYILYSSIQLVVSGRVPLEPALLLATFLPVFIILPILAGVVYLFWFYPARQTRRFADAPLCQGPITGVAMDETLLLRSEASEATVRWDALVGYKMSDGVALLYKSKTTAQLVSRSLFASDGDWRRFRDHVRATVPNQA